jgi:hypothetical protein
MQTLQQFSNTIETESIIKRNENAKLKYLGEQDQVV